MLIFLFCFLLSAPLNVYCLVNSDTSLAYSLKLKIILSKLFKILIMPKFLADLTILLKFLLTDGIRRIWARGIVAQSDWTDYYNRAHFSSGVLLGW